MRTFHLPGSRIVKTAIAIFITAYICEMLNWPAVFAVITAIVTVEPTVSDSIKKGIIRFPASAIGSAYAVLFISWFGNSPITYTLAAFFTITTCYYLRLHAGLLVATLTAVAMIEVIHSHYLMAFFIRLGTTTIGLLVSTAVNFFIFPPDYEQEIKLNIQHLKKKIGKITDKVFTDLLENNEQAFHDNQGKVNQLRKKIQQTENLLRFQQEEAKFHPLVGSGNELFEALEKELSLLKATHFHLNNLVHSKIQNVTWPDEEVYETIKHAVDILTENMSNSQQDKEQLQNQLNVLMNLFRKNRENMTELTLEQQSFFSPRTIILYELVSMYHHIYDREQSMSE